jgi:hypothetical protein
MKLRLSDHGLKMEKIVELCTDAGEVLAAIYATPRGVKIVSQHIQNTPDLVAIEVQYPPALLINIL